MNKLEDVQEAKEQFLKKVGFPFPDWLKGIGIGLPEDNTKGYFLQINVDCEENQHTAYLVVLDANIRFDIDYRIDVVGDIVFL